MADEIDLSANVPVAPSVRKFRRIITGEGSGGNATILVDEDCPNSHAILGIPEFAVTELWKTTETPAQLGAHDADPAAGPTTVPPPPGGTVLRVVEFPPDKAWSDTPAGSRGAMMHRTASIDYAFVIDGEIYAVLDEGETLMRPGDFLIQRGTNHAWSNRSDKPAHLLFVLIDAIPPQQ